MHGWIEQRSLGGYRVKKIVNFSYKMTSNVRLVYNACMWDQGKTIYSQIFLIVHIHPDDGKLTRQ